MLTQPDISSEEYYCPMCFRKLIEKYDGMVCKNHQCKLYWKLNKGWVLRTGEDTWSMKRKQVNGFYNSTLRMWAEKEFVEKKREILIRDDYTCQRCGYTQADNFLWNIKNRLEVHHIIPASEEMALYFDNTNLITLCLNCHKEIHSLDKRTFSSKKVVD